MSMTNLNKLNWSWHVVTFVLGHLLTSNTKESTLCYYLRLNFKNKVIATSQLLILSYVMKYYYLWDLQKGDISSNIFMHKVVFSVVT